MKISSFLNQFILALSLLTMVAVPITVNAQQVQEGAAAVTRVNINTATVEALAKSLKGVGLKKAEAIVNYRDEHGRFASLDDLLNVKGIGESIITRNQKRITFQ